ncbi:MAG: hypothetical protein IJG81_10810 [Muribaculaceae bacterium]|nr:hypothetical protein [Muribaculaceae bacterium]
MIKETRKILLFAALLLSSTCCIYSQTYNVRGSVSAIDSIDLREKYCENCHVFLNDTLETITDKYGEFEFTNIPNGIHKLLIQTSTCSRNYNVIVENKDYYNVYTLNFNHEKYITQAKSNIENNTPVIYEIGGIAPVSIPGEYGFESFHNKFNTKVKVIGCTIDTDYETYVECNFLAFEWLSNHFGTWWRSGKWREMLKYIDGFSDWEKIHDQDYLISKYPNFNNRNPLVVIDGLVIDANPAITYDRDSIIEFVTKICPIIQENDIDTCILSQITSCRPATVILVRTKPESGIDTILLNGHVSKRKNKVELINFVSSEPPKFSLLEKKWKLNRITSLKIHANGKEAIDDNNNKHIIFVEVETK